MEHRVVTSHQKNLLLRSSNFLQICREDVFDKKMFVGHTGHKLFVETVLATSSQ